MTEIKCPACDRGEKTVTPPHSSVVGSAPVHSPSGQVCLKSEAAQIAMRKLSEVRDRQPTITPPPERIWIPRKTFQDASTYEYLTANDEGFDVEYIGADLVPQSTCTHREIGGVSNG